MVVRVEFEGNPLIALNNYYDDGQHNSDCPAPLSKIGIELNLPAPGSS